MALVRRQRQEFVKTLQHLADMKGGRKRTFARHVLVEMADVGGEHDPAAAGVDAHELQPRRMTGCRVEGQARREFGVAMIEHDPARIVQPHHPADVLDLEGMRQPLIAHVTPGGISQFALLKMKSRRREAVEIADMVVVQMGEDHILDAIGVDAERTERLHRAAQEGALALLRCLRIEAGIDDEGSACTPRHPDEIVHRHRPVMRIAADEMLAPPRLARRITDGKELVFLFGHGISLPYSASVRLVEMSSRLYRIRFAMTHAWLAEP